MLIVLGMFLGCAVTLLIGSAFYYSSILGDREKAPRRKSEVALFIAVMMLTGVPVQAANVTLSWDNPSEYCDGTPIALGDITHTEIYISDAPIPAADQSCSTPVDEAPPGFAPVTVPATETTTSVNLVPGKTYYFRVRVGNATGWSNLSGQVSKVIPPGVMRAPIVLQIS